MKGNSINEFINDILTIVGPEKEFVFRNKFYFLEALAAEGTHSLDLHMDEYDNTNPKDKIYLTTWHFRGNTQRECLEKFEHAPLFNGMTIDQAEREIEVLFG